MKKSKIFKNFLMKYMDGDIEARLVDSGSGLAFENVGAKNSNESWLFFWLGNVSLLVFNIAINAIDIYKVITKDNNIGNDLNRAYNIPSSIAALLLCFITITNHKLSFIINIIGLIVCVIILAISMFINTSSKTIYWISVITIGLSGIFSSIILSSSFALAAQFSEESSTAVSSGNGLCGVLAAVLRIITKAVFSSESQLKYSSLSYFVLAALIILATLIYFIKRLRQPAITRKFIFKTDKIEIRQFLKSVGGVFKHIFFLWLGMTINFLITLVLFPGYVTGGPQGILKSWTDVLITTIFCVFDWLGRWLPSKFIWSSAKYSIIPILLRLVFFPLEMISLQKLVNLGEPWYTIFMMIPFALTNGYFGTVVMIQASTSDRLNDEQKKIAGFLMAFAINFGIIIAMFLTYVMPIPKS